MQFIIRFSKQTIRVGCDQSWTNEITGQNGLGLTHSGGTNFIK